jgi:hypothetical protein
MERAMRRTNTTLIALALVVLTFGCTPLTSPLDLVGTYSLKTVNGDSIPDMLPQHGATTVLVLDDMFTLTTGGTYSEIGHEQITTGGVASVSTLIDAGIFTRRNDALVLNSVLFGDRPASVKNRTLTLVQNGLTLVYQM